MEDARGAKEKQAAPLLPSLNHLLNCLARAPRPAGNQDWSDEVYQGLQVVFDYCCQVSPALNAPASGEITQLMANILLLTEGSATAANKPEAS